MNFNSIFKLYENNLNPFNECPDENASECLSNKDINIHCTFNDETSIVHYDNINYNNITIKSYSKPSGDTCFFDN
ncbi:hypothetical protein U3516DRAFT_751259 [Neocallimastix sp. 'constans']